jgi:spermidine/putrescine ABC transporter ATP-binding subunit
MQVSVMDREKATSSVCDAGRNATSLIVQMRGVSKTYHGGPAPALHPTDLSIRTGEFFSILGPSGSGKTTTLRLIAGFEKPDRGTVSLGGVNVTELPPNRRDVNTVFQNYALFPHLSVEDNVAYPLQMRKMARDVIKLRVSEALDLVDMAGFGNRLPHQLSGGQRQRIALARALVGRPKVLLLDEPLGALDLRLRQQMQHVLTSLQQRLGITFIYVTHDQGEALSMSNRVAVMNKGRVEQIGTPEDLYYSPKNEFVANFVGKSNLLEVDVRRADGGFRSFIGDYGFALPQAKMTGAAKLVLRCESIRVGYDQMQGNSAGLPAVVENVLFLGTGLEVSLDCGGTRLLALVPARRDRDLSVGDAVFCHFRADEAVVLHE